MKGHIFCVSILLWSLLICDMAVAGEKGAPVPNLLGTWISKSHKVFYVKGSMQAVREVRITEPDGYFFRGYDSRTHNGKRKVGLGEVGGKIVKKASEPIVGVVAFDGKTIYISEQGDWGRYYARLVGEDTMEVIKVESGPAALANRFVLTRKR